jgi:hypothetical protein
MRLQRLDRSPLLDDDEGVGAEAGEAGRAVADVDDRVVGEAAVFAAHGIGVGAPGIEDAIAHSRQGGDDGEDVDHRQSPRVDVGLYRVRNTSSRRRHGPPR